MTSEGFIKKLIIRLFQYLVENQYYIIQLFNQDFKMVFQALVLVFISIFIGITNSAGLGGGSIINVMLISGLNYSAKKSITISYIILIGGALAAIITGAKKFTPSGKRCIDYDLVIRTLPMMMSGAIVGITVNHLISQLIITLILIALVLNLSYTSYNRLKQADLSPSKKIQQRLVQLQLLPVESPKTKQSAQMKQRLSSILQEQKALFPSSKLKLLTQIYLYTIIIVLFRGGKNFDSVIGLSSCGIGSFLLIVAHILLSYLFCKATAVKQIQQDQQKENLGFVFKNPHDKMSYEKMNEGMFNGFVAGVLGASVAVGGGLVLVPLWLKSGIQKEIVTNSTAPLILFSSSISFFVCVLLGQYQSFWEVMMYLCISFVGCFIVKNLVVYLTQQYGLKKLIYMILLVLMMIWLAVFLPLQISKYQNGRQDFMEFGSFC